jgi:hypothetical protein
MENLPEGDACRKAQELSRHYGVTPQTIYRWCWTKGLRWRKHRADKGKTAAPKKIVEKAAAILNACKRANKQIPMPGCHAKEILEDSGFETGVSTSRFLSLLRREKISAQDLLRPSPHVRLLSEHPNHVWQFDVTNCLQYFLDDKGMGERDPDMELYKNKIVKTAKEIKKELLRYVAVDHCTGAFFLWYYYASGERAMDGADFLFKAMRPKDELIRQVFNGSGESKTGKYHFHGVPFILVPDRGSIIVDQANQNLFKSLKIDVKPHMPGNPRAKGAVEGLMHIINAFEARLKLMRPKDLGELNGWSLDWTIRKNGFDLMRHLAPRSALWSMIRSEQLRLCPDRKIYTMLIRRPDIECKADGSRLIQFNRKFYQIPDPNAARQKVKVVINPYELPAVEVHFNGFVWLVEPIGKDEYGRLEEGVPYGQYRAIKQTETQRAKKELEEIAEGWGLKWKGTGDKRIAVSPPVGYESPLQVFGHQADKVKVDFINRKGTDLEIEPPAMPENRPITADAVQISRSIADRQISFTEFLKRLVQRVGPISKEMNQELRAKYGDSISVQDAETVINEIESGTVSEGSQQKAVGSEKEMKAISLYQPWAILTVLREKRYETRSWSTHYRGPLLICSSKRKLPVWKWPPIGKVIEALRRAGLSLDDLNYGCVLGIVDLNDIIRTEEIADKIGDNEKCFGNFSPGRFAWDFDHVRRLLKPFPVRGGQRLFEIDWQGKISDPEPYWVHGEGGR